MTTELFLIDQELARLTGFKIKSRQIGWLRSEGIPFRVSATGHPVVTRLAIEGPAHQRSAPSPAPVPWVPAVLQQGEASAAKPVRTSARRAHVGTSLDSSPLRLEHSVIPTAERHYPAGALLRVKDICGDRQQGRPGLLPIVSRTWLKWVEEGKVPKGILLGTRTRVWPVEQVLAVRDGLVTGETNARLSQPAATRQRDT